LVVIRITTKQFYLVIATEKVPLKHFFFLVQSTSTLFLGLALKLSYERYHLATKSGGLKKLQSTKMDGAFLCHSDQICCALQFLAAFNGVAFGCIFYPYCFSYIICFFPEVDDSCLLVSMHCPFCPYFQCVDKLGQWEERKND
jgi:hypothetical protein